MDRSFELSELDRKILDALQDDARLSSQDIAHRVSSSPSSVWRRIRAMEDAGVISGFRVTVDAEKLGLHETILVNVRLDRHTPETTAA
ncbi:MAG: winged helix-turn-helix transcriptional regulator, partial [Rhizobiaceae bacterium]|nr:winged helix-turn-helix transcriptional regulator [Rhizobiaceae bacterium]